MDTYITGKSAFYGTEGFDIDIGQSTSTFRDAPGDWIEDRSVGKQFILCVIGEKKDKDPEYLGSIRWGYYINKDGEIMLRTAKPKDAPTIDAAVPEELGHALFRWNRIKGNETIERLTNVKIEYPKVNPPK